MEKLPSNKNQHGEQYLEINIPPPPPAPSSFFYYSYYCYYDDADNDGEDDDDDDDEKRLEGKGTDLYYWPCTNK